MDFRREFQILIFTAEGVNFLFFFFPMISQSVSFVCRAFGKGENLFLRGPFSRSPQDFFFVLRNFSSTFELSRSFIQFLKTNFFQVDICVTFTCYRISLTFHLNLLLFLFFFYQLLFFFFLTFLF